ncbi:MAG TPA: hypothetical protein VIZ43_17620 [Trebonia sp.]
MYVILAFAALLVVGGSCLTAYLVTVGRRARKREAVAARLEAVAARAAREYKDRTAAAEASAALTAVLPAIPQEDDDRTPRRVA